MLIMSISVLLIDDNVDDARLLIAALEEARGVRFQVTHVETLERALRVLAAQAVDIVLFDLSPSEGQDASGVARLAKAFRSFRLLP